MQVFVFFQSVQTGCQQSLHFSRASAVMFALRLRAQSKLSSGLFFFLHLSSSNLFISSPQWSSELRPTASLKCSTLTILPNTITYLLSSFFPLRDSLHLLCSALFPSPLSSAFCHGPSACALSKLIYQPLLPRDQLTVSGRCLLLSTRYACLVCNVSVLPSPLFTTFLIQPGPYRLRSQVSSTLHSVNNCSAENLNLSLNQHGVVVHVHNVPRLSQTWNFAGTLLT